VARSKAPVKKSGHERGECKEESTWIGDSQKREGDGTTGGSKEKWEGLVLVP